MTFLYKQRTAKNFLYEKGAYNTPIPSVKQTNRAWEQYRKAAVITKYGSFTKLLV